MSLDDDMALLARQPLLSLMERDALRLLAFAAESRTLRAGDVLFRAGEASDGAVLVVSGALALATADDGRPANDIVGPGALVGELALFTSVPRQATAIAREPTQVMRLPRSVMRRVLGNRRPRRRRSPPRSAIGCVASSASWRPCRRRCRRSTKADSG